jgi:hypothetical protein
MRTSTEYTIAVQRMMCSACGAEANASCDCGKPYVPAKLRAAEAIAANPQKSNRAIADDIGVGEPTVRRARQESGASHDAPEREGKDGKVYRLPVRERNSESESTIGTLADEYRRHAVSHTNHVALATKDMHRAGRALLQLKELVEAKGEIWWDFYAANFDKPCKWAEQAMKAID